MNVARASFLEAYASLRPLLTHPRLAEGWNDDSALTGFSTRGLAGHLVRAGAAVLSYLEDPAPEAEEPVRAALYYATVLPSMDATDHSSVITRGEESAGRDAPMLLRAYDDSLKRLRQALATEAPDRLVRVFRGVVLTLDDYLTTRIVEILVHGDDLAVTLRVERPHCGPEALDVAIRHLVDVARAMHGDWSILIALARRERDAIDALRVFAPPPSP